VEAAAYRGRPVYFETLGDWTRPDRAQLFQLTKGRRAAYQLAFLFLIALAVGSVLLARYNVRLGRGDRVGARRLAVAALTGKLLVWLLAAHHVADLQGELTVIVRGLGLALFYAAVIGELYLALEPFVRRHWPDTLISWTRLLAGRWRDPIVGRDLLSGSVLGAVCALSFSAGRSVIPAALGIPPPAPFPGDLDALLGVRLALVTLGDAAVNSLMQGMAVVLLRLGLLRALRVEALAAAAFILLLSIQDALVAGTHFWPMLAVYVVVVGLPVYAITRLGLLPTVAAFFVSTVLLVFPQTPRLGHWAMQSTLVAVIPVLLLMLYAHHVGRARRAFA
jgi:hypothetical protein